MSGDVFTGMAALVGAVGTVISVYLAYKVRMVEHQTNGHLSELRAENLELGERVTELVNQRDHRP